MGQHEGTAETWREKKMEATRLFGGYDLDDSNSLVDIFVFILTRIQKRALRCRVEVGAKQLEAEGKGTGLRVFGL